MAEKQEEHQKQVTPTAEPVSEVEETTASDDMEPVADKQPTTVSRPRARDEANQVVEQGVGRSSQRQPRPKAGKSRGLETQARRPGTGGEQIQRREKREPVNQTARAARASAADLRIEHETLKWAAYGALLISLISLVLLGVYSIRKFTPQFEFQDVQNVQAQMTTEIQQLQLALDLETVKRTIMNAHLQLLLHKDPEAAESILTTAKKDLQSLLVALPSGQKAELKQLVGRLDSTIHELRRPQAALDQELKQILFRLDHL